MTEKPLDTKDRAILAILQQDATQPIAEIANQVHLSTTACWKRIQRLQQAGVIKRQVCLLDRHKIDAGITVFVSIRTNRHEPQWLDEFAQGVSAFPEVVEFYRLAGETDYLLKVVVPDIAGFDRVYKKLISTVDLYDVSSSFCMEEIKYTTAMPLDHY
ncbi:Lrp/AsnC family transcriptional regulator [Allopusillimonas ginsengisoli]|uniref:Lrp/AsnC family transcriptional regulator n=1 Tax=Allopusillimonas ginsengisoli TaxID=453575 RepID=UPI0010C1DDB9|nr:Lrp/AsnC family transcriptional regulator [Allopusillimonas ginsengisoli]